MQCVCARRPESFDTPLAYIACSIGHSDISLVVIKCSKSNTNAIGDTDCTSASAVPNGIGYSDRVDGQRRHSRNIDTPATGGNGWVRQVLGEAQQTTEWNPGVHVIVL